MINPGTCDARTFVLVRAASMHYALPAGAVTETMRPLPLRPASAMPAWCVIGLATIRGRETAVIDFAAALATRSVADAAAAGRFLSLRLATASFALAVDAVIGVQSMSAAEASALAALPANTLSRVAAAFPEGGALADLLGSIRIFDLAASGWRTTVRA
jgi:chemotaxis signal transduction protein